MKLAFVDLETTGIEHPACGVIQIGIILEVGGREVLRESFTCAPFLNDRIEQEALDVNRRTEAEIRAFMPPQLVYGTIVKHLTEHVDRFAKHDKFHFVAYNAPFDAGHLRAWFAKCGDQYYGSYFWHPPLCVMHYAAFTLAEKRATLPNFKLATVARVFGVDVDDTQAHDALYDIDITRRLFQAIAPRTISGGITA